MTQTVKNLPAVWETRGRSLGWEDALKKEMATHSSILWTAARQASLSITKSQSLLKLMSIESVIPSNQLMLCRTLLLLPSIYPSIRVFSNESVFCIRWSKYWSFSFSISSSNEYSGLNSFRMDWEDLLAVQGTLRSLLQHHSSKASFFRLRLLIFLPAILIPACNSSSPEFLMTYSAYKLNKQGDNIQPCIGV